MKKYVIIVAGGSGSRMGAEVPKQFLLINGKPILMHTIAVFKKYDPDIHVVLVLPKAQFTYWENLCADHNFKGSYDLVAGGETRFHSVSNGLNSINEEGLIAIHDGVRPLIGLKTIADCYNEAERSGAVIPVKEMVETLRYEDEKESYTLDRTKVKAVQTPQVFQSQIIKKAYEQPFQSFFTDDASVVEHSGHHVNAVLGNLENIKITTPMDLKIASCLLTDAFIE